MADRELRLAISLVVLLKQLLELRVLLLNVSRGGPGRVSDLILLLAEQHMHSQWRSNHDHSSVEYLLVKVLVGLALCPLHDIVAADDGHCEVDHTHGLLASLRQRDARAVDLLLELLMALAQVTQELHSSSSSLNARNQC